MAEKNTSNGFDLIEQKWKNSSDNIYPLSDILDRFDKDMDESDKKLINSILVEQKWMK